MKKHLPRARARLNPLSMKDEAELLSILPARAGLNPINLPLDRLGIDTPRASGAEPGARSLVIDRDLNVARNILALED